jgi:hypothetical protein
MDLKSISGPTNGCSSNDDISAGSNFGSDTTGANRFVTMTVVPEPSVAVLLGGICTMLMLRRRRA